MRNGSISGLLSQVALGATTVALAATAASAWGIGAYQSAGVFLVLLALALAALLAVLE